MKKEYSIKILILLLGNLIAAFGVFLCAVAGKGVDPITVLLHGIMNLTNVSIGISVLILHGLLMLLCFCIDTKTIQLGTILSVLSFSGFLNLLMTQFDKLSFVGNTPFALLALAIGIGCMGVGFSTCIHAGIGPNTTDVVLELLNKKSNLSIRFCKIIIDFSCTILGLLFGATFGVGTVLCVLFVGMVYSINLKALQKINMKKRYRYV